MAFEGDARSIRAIIHSHFSKLRRQGGRVLALRALLDQYDRVERRCRLDPRYQSHLFSFVVGATYSRRYFGPPTEHTPEGEMPRSYARGPMPSGIRRTQS